MEWWRQAFYMVVVYAIAIFATIRQLLRGNKKPEDISRHDGKVAIVTGGASGIGLETAKVLCKKGVQVVLGTPHSKKARKAIEAIKKDNALARVEWIPLDLSSLQSVRDFAESFLDKRLPLHILVNNAGIMATPYCKTADDFEMQFQVNYLGHYLLTRLLLDKLHTSAHSRSYARIINVSSIAHFGGWMDASHMPKIMPKKEYSPYKAYADSKLAVVLGTQELQRRIYRASRRVTVNSLHPGVVGTQLYQNLHPIMQMAKIIFSQLGLIWTSKKGSATSIYAALSDEMEGVGGCYLDNCGSVASCSLSYDRKLQVALWKESCEWCRLPVDITSHRTLKEMNNQQQQQQNGRTRMGSQ
ncbi:dehydrogenase/reductase SDR family member on chromosome X-like [Lytechinus variegatus]|uniref:dehydrogenase/reductase SDR family member on chromosome X-like n=1 Tax=Lytechinus variegatus TaxID=7654 RepID=UPI001BB195EA|nr:dehydrogenase/reductase SDR family member on chromosome X-like [Lytechinus variegatus]